MSVNTPRLSAEAEYFVITRTLAHFIYSFCVSSTVLKARLSYAAVPQAKYYVQQALASSASLAIGSGSQRPFNHGFMIADWASDRHASDPSVSLMDASNGSQPAARYTALSGSDRSLDRGFVRQAMRLYAVTDPDCNARVGRTMEEAVKQAVAGGATIVQIREKHAGGGGFLATARAAYEVWSPLTCDLSDRTMTPNT